MPRIKTMPAEGRVVRVFSAGQLIRPRLIGIVGELGEFDMLCLDQADAETSLFPATI